MRITVPPFALGYSEQTSPPSRTPPKEQASYERWSTVFFTRPSNDVELVPLTEDSPMIAEAVNSSPNPSKFYTGQTAATWFARRVKYERVKNMTVGGGPCAPATTLTSAYRVLSLGVQAGARSTPSRCRRLSPFKCRMLKAESNVSLNLQLDLRSTALYPPLNGQSYW